MPWRKYNKKEGKNGSIYYITRGIQVRCIACGKWVLFMEKDGIRKNRAFGLGRDGLVKAIRAAEDLAPRLNTLSSAQPANKPKPEVPKFEGYSKRWLENNSGRWHVNTYQRYEGILRLHIWPENDLKDKRLDEVTRQVIKCFLVNLFKTRSAATVELAHSIFHGVFEEAVDDKIHGTNPTKGLLKKILPAKRQRDDKEPDPFDIEERDLFLGYAEQTYTVKEQLILMVMVHAGFRLGEVLAMRLRHLDFYQLTYHVSESYKQHRFSKPKGGKKRLVDLPDFLVDELKKYILHLKKENLKNGKGGGIDLLFPDPKEHGYWPYSQRKIQDLVKRVCKGAELRFRNPHDLRHTYATILLTAHQSPAYVQKLLGHSSISITVDSYGHWMPGEGRQGLEEALLGSVRNPVENRISPHLKEKNHSK